MLELGKYMPTLKEHLLLISGVVINIIGIILFFVWTSKNSATREKIVNNNFITSGKSEYITSMILMSIGIVVMFISIYMSHRTPGNNILSSSEEIEIENS